MKDPVNSTRSIVSKRSAHKPGLKDDEEVIDMLIVIPPDGGWGWVVVAASFYMNLVIDGTMYTFGMFLDDISKSFEKPKTKVAITNSLMTGAFYLIGPLVSGLTNKYGFRVVAILGGVLSSLSYLIAATLSSLSLFYFVYGILGGISFCMIYIPSIVIVGFYFEKWRALATAITACGSSFGIIIVPTLITFLHSYSWRTKFQILSLPCVTVAIVAIVFRPLKPRRVVPADDKKVVFTITEPKGAEEAQTSGGAKPVKKKKNPFKRMFNNLHNQTYPTAAEVHKGLSTTVILEEPRRMSSLSVLVEPGSMASFSLRSVRSKLSKTSTWLSEGGGLETVAEEDDKNMNCCKRCCMKCYGRVCYCYMAGHVHTAGRPMYRDDIFYSGSVATLNHYSRSVISQPGISAAPAKSGLEYHMSVTRSMTVKDFQEDYFCMCCPIAIKRTLVTMLNFNLLKSPSFFLIVMSGFFTILGLYTPFTYIKERMEFMKIEQIYCDYILTVMGIANTAGRIVSGVAVTLRITDARTFTYVSLGIAGVANTLAGLSHTLAFQYGYATTFAFMVACIGSIRTILIVEMLGIEKLTNAFGILMTFQGVACLAGLPIAGVLIDKTKDYNASFIFSGACIVVGVVFLLPVKRVANWEARREAQR